MPTETDKTAAIEPDPRDLQITDLKSQLEQLSRENDALAQDLETARKELKSKKVQTTPAGDYCVLGGKTYQVAGTVMTRFASEEGRKSNTEDEELVILKR
jgi:hypothetical protein